MENGVKKQFDVNSLVQDFESSEQQGREGRLLAERDRDYVNGEQLTDDELSTLRQRGQPPVIFNRIKPKLDSLLGYEQKMRADPKAYPRTQQHEQDAESITDAIRYVLDSQRYEAKRGMIADDLFVEGCAALSITVKKKNQSIEICLNHVPWDRFYYDPFSRIKDFSDCKFKGIVIWMDADEAEERFGKEGRDLIESSLSSNGAGSLETFDDRPQKTKWTDSKRKRVRVCQHYWKNSGKWWHAIFCKAGYLAEPEPSPYLNEDGETECPIVAGSAYINRENERYGAVRMMISPQDEINKRRSKALHYLNSRQVIAEDGAVRDVALAKRELARPDGYIEVNPNFRFDVGTPIQMAMAEMQLLQDARMEIDAGGINPALSGDMQATSGRALEHMTQAGLSEMTTLFDSLRDWNWRVYRTVWNRVRQYWTAEKWIRVTDDEKNIKWVGLNEQVKNEFGQATGQVRNDVSKLDVDIVLSDAPDSVTIQSEQFELLTKMWEKAPDRIPIEAVIQASSLRNKKELLEAMKGPEGPDPAQQKMQEIEMRRLSAEASVKESSTAKNYADVEKTRHEIGMSLANKQHELESTPQNIM